MAAIFRLYYQAYQGLPRVVWLLSSLLLVSNCGSMVLPFLTIYLAKIEGYPESVAVGFMAVYGVGGIAGAFLGGVLSRQFGALRVLVGSLLVRAPAYVVIPWCGSLAELTATILWVSVAAETGRPAIAIATSQHAPPEALARSFALNRLAANLGFAIGPAVGGLLAARGLWGWLFWINAGATLLSALAAVRFFGLGGGRARPPTTSAAPGAGSPWNDGRFLAFLGLQLLSGLVFFQLMSTYPVYLSEQSGLREDQIGSLFVINTLTIVLFEMLVTDRLRRWRPIRLVALGTGFVCLGFGGTLLASGYAYVAALVLVWTLGEMLCAPFAITHAAQRAAGRNREAYLGLNSATFATAAVGAPVVGGLLYRVDPPLVWWCCLAMALVLPGGFWALAEREAPAPAADKASG